MYKYVDKRTIKINNESLSKYFYLRHHRNTINPKFMENEKVLVNPGYIVGIRGRPYKIYLTQLWIHTLVFKDDAA